MLDTPGKPAETEQERKAYFQPFKEGNKSLCGAPKKNCSKCGHKFVKEERLLTECPECGALRRCRRVDYGQNGRCKRHGGAMKTGELASNYRHGRHVNTMPFLPKEVQKAYVEASAAVDLVSTREEICFVRARLMVVSQNIKDATHWRDELLLIVDEIEKHRAAAQAGDKKAASAVAAAVDQLMTKAKDGAAQSQWWDEALDLNDRSADLKVKHSQIERASGAVLSATQALDFVTVIGRAVREALLLVKGRVSGVRAVLRDRDEVVGIVDNAVAAIESGGDVRENIEAAVDRVLESIPLETVEGSFSEANEIVQSRIRGMIER